MPTMPRMSPVLSVVAVLRAAVWTPMVVAAGLSRSGVRWLGGPIGRGVDPAYDLAVVVGLNASLSVSLRSGPTDTSKSSN